jgi:hypothetical protein
MNWKTPTSSRMIKARMSKLKVKKMMIVFFHIRGVIIIKWVLEGQTDNRKYYLGVLTKLRERGGRKARNFGRRNHGFCFKTMRHSQRPRGEAVFSR